MDLEKTDLSFADHGATWLMHSNTAAGAEWIKRYIPANAQTFGKGIVIGHRYALSIVKLTIGDGLKIDVDGQTIKGIVEHIDPLL
jgi:hypothetical protein